MRQLAVQLGIGLTETVNLAVHYELRRLTGEHEACLQRLNDFALTDMARVTVPSD